MASGDGSLTASTARCSPTRGSTGASPGGIPARWALVFRGSDARVFVRRLPRFSSLIAAHEIPATFAFSVEEGAVTLPLEARPAASPVADCEWSRRLGDLLFELDGALSERARAAYERALAAPAGCLAPRRRGAARRLAGRGRFGAGRADAALVPPRARARRRKSRALDLHRPRGGAGGARPPRRRRPPPGPTSPPAPAIPPSPSAPAPAPPASGTQFLVPTNLAVS